MMSISVQNLITVQPLLVVMYVIWYFLHVYVFSTVFLVRSPLYQEDNGRTAETYTVIGCAGRLQPHVKNDVRSQYPCDANARSITHTLTLHFSRCSCSDT